MVAVVNEEIITLNELDQEAGPTLDKIRSEVPPSQLESTLMRARKDILRSMIEQKLLQQRADQRHISVSNEELDSAINSILQENNIGVDEFRSQLRGMGSSEALYRDSLKKQILRNKLLAYEIRSKVVVTDEQIKEYYKTMQHGNDGPEGYHILQIGTTWGDKGGSPTKEQAERKANQLREMILAGENFNEIAKRYSDLPSAKDGGDIGFLNSNEMAASMRDSISSMRAGDISGVLETSSGYQFFKVLSCNVGGVVSKAPLSEVREEIRTTLYDQELRKKFDSWVQELRDNAYIEELL